MNDTDRLTALLRRAHQDLVAAGWPCPHCDEQQGSSSKLDLHLRFHCPALGRRS